MALPKIDLPVYQCELPSLKGKKVKFRPFTVKEEKILLTAQESEETEQVLISIRQILNNCLLDKDVSELAIFDIEYLLIQLRSKSVDNKVEFEITDPDTEEKVAVEFNLDSVKVLHNKDHSNKIVISDQYTLFLKYPTIDNFESLMTKKEPTSEDSYQMMLACLDKLASADEVFNFKDFPKEEIDSFVESLHSDTVKNIKIFFDTMPKVRHEIPYKNSKGESNIFVIEGTQTFFI
jgi:hypothetical protein